MSGTKGWRTASLNTSTQEVSHTDRWAYRHLYSDRIFSLTTALYPAFGRRVYNAISIAVAKLFSTTQPGVRHAVERNLARLCGSCTNAESHEVFANFARCISDYVAVGAMGDEEIDKVIGSFTGHEHFNSLEPGRGAILATGHYSFFELGAVVLSRRGHKITVATLPEPSSELTNWRAGWRRRWGVDTIEVGADPFSSLGMTRSIEAGRLTAVLADRPQEGQAIDVPAKGGTVPFSRAPAVLSLLTGAPILPVIIARELGGKYGLVALPPEKCHKVEHSRRDQEIERCTHAIGRSLLSEMEKAPREWFQFAALS